MYVCNCALLTFNQRTHVHCWLLTLSCCWCWQFCCHCKCTSPAILFTVHLYMYTNAYWILWAWFEGESIKTKGALRAFGGLRKHWCVAGNKHFTTLHPHNTLTNIWVPYRFSCLALPLIVSAPYLRRMWAQVHILCVRSRSLTQSHCGIYADAATMQTA